MPIIKAERKSTSMEGYLNNLAEDNITDYNNPKCIDCNDCCSITSTVTKKEIYEIKLFMKKHKKITKAVNSNIKKMNKIRQTSNDVDLSCPFSDRETKRCLIYKARPAVCREFHCYGPLRKNIDDVRGIPDRKIIGDIFNFSTEDLFEIIRNNIIASEGQEGFDRITEKFNNK